MALQKPIATRRTVVMQGPLAYGMRRIAAARAAECGLQIMTLPQMAARLAGGFLHLATSEVIEPAVREALAGGGFQELEPVRDLPGMTRAVAHTLSKAWHADLRLQHPRWAGSPRLADLALIEERVKQQLPPAAMLPADLRDAAHGRLARAPLLLGAVRIEGVHFIEPVWRSLLNDLCDAVAVEWLAPDATDTAWFRGAVERSGIVSDVESELVTCADPRHEALEALRWVRRLLASGSAKASEIGICAASTEEWDDHILALADAAKLRIHFPHGIPCLSTREGQRCAALADVLLNGLSQARVRRLLSLAGGQGTVLDRLPEGGLPIAPDASLSTVAEWTRALDNARSATLETKQLLGPVLFILARGPDAASEAADALLRGRSRRLWDAATRSAPAAALEFTLRMIRIPDERDPGDSVVWCPAWQLAAAPRPFVRMLGLTGRGWPRRFGEDPILPSHIVPAAELESDPPAEADRRTFEIISAKAAGALVLSRGRRNAQGTLSAPSPLLPADRKARALARARTPEHALTESDRLAGRPRDAAQSTLMRSAAQCWRDWHVSALTAHDGLVQPGHPVIRHVLTRVQSPTSLRRLLRDPLGFVWRYAFGWDQPGRQDQPLTLPADEFGKLVHELLRRIVDALEPAPGFTVAHRHEIETALAAAVETVVQTWPLERPVPPHFLWINTVRRAAAMSVAGLTLEQFTEAGTRSWTEVPFGLDRGTSEARELPWDATRPVTVPGTAISVRGSIDRVDLREDGSAVRVTDYKTGERTRDPAGLVIGGGTELQRSLYALACRELLDGAPRIVARLIYLKDEPAIFPLTNPDESFEQVFRFVKAACAALEAGKAIPGIDAESATNDLRFALPASPGYFRRKQLKFREAAGDLARFWSAR